MDFFAAQEAAKRRTGWSIVLFAVGVVLTALSVYSAVVWTLWGVQSGFSLQAPWYFALQYPKIFTAIFGGTALVILLASLFHLLQLSRGGISVAEAVGARILDLNTSAQHERRLLNVVEEMAIASGTPMPAVGVLDNEREINAFAAALAPRDAVVVVTQGALEKLTRDELQAVIGHEFSHLMNGDSRMNITLAGWVWGLFFVTVVGRVLMRVRGGSSEERKSGAGLAMLGLAFFVIGWIGYLFGRLIQALISRQREFLADASAVQFTRNPQAMLSTLAKLGAGSCVLHPEATGLAHFFFAPASQLNAWSGPFATHPPLSARMKAIDPHYTAALAQAPEDGVADATPADSGAHGAHVAKVEVPFAPATLVGLVAAAGTVRGGGHTLEDFARRLPAALVKMLSEPVGVQAILLRGALPDAAVEAALAGLQGQLNPQLWSRLAELGEWWPVQHRERTLLAQLAAARGRRLGVEELLAFGQALERVIALDGQLTTLEVLYAQWALHALGVEQKAQLQAPHIISRVLSYMYREARGSVSDDHLQAVVEGLALPAAQLRALPQLTTEGFREALSALPRLGYLMRRELLIALGRILKLDKVLEPHEEEKWRLLAGLMDCPIPLRGV